MFPMSKFWKMIAAVGYGVLFSQALTGAVRIACWLLGTTLSVRAAGNLFMISSLLTGALSAYLCSRSLKQAELRTDGPTR
jgi:hypothetical protein